MRKLIPKEELDALFKEIYSSEVTDKDYNKTARHIKEETDKYRFLLYKYKLPLKKILISSIPVKVKIVDIRIYKQEEIEDKNVFLSSYDIEEKFRFYITISENISSVEKSIYEDNIYSLFQNENNTPNLQLILENIYKAIVKTVQTDFPFKFRKLNRPIIQFYDNNLIVIEYVVKMDKEDITVSLLFEELMLETIDINPFIYSPPTSYGKKNLDKLKEKIPLKVIAETQPINIDLNMLKENCVIDLNRIKINNYISGGGK
ncbi:hypothetical protein [Persephonella sp.]